MEMIKDHIHGLISAEGVENGADDRILRSRIALYPLVGKEARKGVFEDEYPAHQPRVNFGLKGQGDPKEGTAQIVKTKG